MPSTIQGSTFSRSGSMSFHETYDYEYPEGLDLRPSSSLHKKLRDYIWERATESAKIMSMRFSSWNEVDQFLTAYKPVDQEEADVQSLDSRKPVSIVFPYSYAIMETLLSYLVAAFFRDPIFRYEGYSGDDVIGAILLEQVVNLHCIKTKVPLALHTMFRDCTAYGIAPVTPGWKTVMGKKKQEEGLLSSISQLFSGYKEEEQVLFEGNELVNIDPYLYLPDPNVSVDKVQDGEFVGWVDPTNLMNLLNEEEHDPEMFNVKYLKQMNGARKTTIYTGDSSGRHYKTGVMKNRNESGVLNPVDRIHMYVKLIPADWGLGDNEYPEKWYFQMVADEIIIKARPAGFDHGKFPIAVAAPDFDGYSATPLGRIEMLSGLQGVLDFMFNSHVANVRKAVNDTIIYDPYLINSADLEDPKPGKLVRTRRPAWGKGVKDAVQQLAVSDITRANISDASYIVQAMQKIASTDDPMMGSMRQGGPERLTSKEFQGTQVGAISRMERIAKVIGLQAFQDVGEFFASHTQQLMTEDVFVKITGNWQDLLMQEYGGQVNRGRIKVRPKDLDIAYDVVVRDGSVPGGNFSETWVQLFNILGQNPELAQRFDVVRIFTHIARNLGAKNVNEFVRKTNVNTMTAPNEAISQGVQQGNLIPFTGGMQ